MKILLADDDKLIRFSLKSMLMEIVNTECIITEAANGEEMINRCIEYEPDIAFVDIRMPKLDGITSIEACREISPNTEFIVLTGYSDFEYAKRCITLGVADYILKPIEPEYLQKTISRLNNKLAARKIQANTRFQLYVLEFFHSPIHDIAPDAEKEILGADGDILIGFTIFIDCKNDHQIYSAIHNRLISSLKSFGAKLLSFNISYAVIYSPEGCLHILFKAPPKYLPRLKSNLEQLCKNTVFAQSRLYLFYTCHNTITEIYRDYEKIDEQSYIRISMNTGDALDIEKSGEVAFPEFYKQLSSLIAAFQSANEFLYKQILNNVYLTYREVPPPNLLPMAAYVKAVLGFTIRTESFKDFMESFVSLSNDMYKNLDYKSSEKIDQIINYINKSYMNDISINQIANKYSLTPNYVSKLFHDKTNTKFIDYLTNLRIMHAKRLLILKFDTPIKDISLMVGYFSPRHFSSIFKNVTGLYPTEYRKKHDGKENNSTAISGQ